MWEERCERGVGCYKTCEGEGEGVGGVAGEEGGDEGEDL